MVSGIIARSVMERTPSDILRQEPYITTVGKKSVATLALLAAASLALAGCTTQLTVSAEDVAAQAADALAPQLGFTPDITCPEDLTAEVGEVLICELEDPEGGVHDATVTVTNVEGTDVDFDVSVG